jgi:uncharacterized damage-inducible protein DinB
MSIAKELLTTQFDYSQHATKLLLELCAKLTPQELELDRKSSHGGILGTLQHIFYADRVWLSRFRGAPVAFRNEGENPSLTELTQSWPPILDGFKDYIQFTEQPTLLEEFTYTNLAGKKITIVRYQALLHVVNHSTHHRGQVVTMLRQAGHTPPVTDLLYYYLDSALSK